MSSYPLRITQKIHEASDCASLWFDVPVDLRSTFDHRPGQFVAVSSEIGGESVTRQYSLSSSPADTRGLRITVKKIPGGRMSSWLVDEVQPGDVIDVATPRGVFFKPLDEPHRVLVFACGSGIAPVLPIARKLLTDGKGHRVLLNYGSRTADEIILKDEVDELGRDYAACRVEHVLSRADGSWSGARGRIDADYLAGRSAQWETEDLPAVVYLCGPEAFMDAAERHFLARGLSQSAIRRESFDLVLDEDDDEPSLVIAGSEDAGELSETCVEIVANVGGEEARVVPEPGESILAALIRGDAPVPYSCQEGTCSSCISKLKQGTANVRPAVLKSLRQDDIDEGLVLACLATPASKRILIDFDDI